MHTDEFEISLHRELKVCKNTIQRIKKTLVLMEQKYHKTTEAFIAELAAGALAPDKETRDDFEVWKGSWESLKQWQDLEQQYEAGFHMMKISDKGERH